MPRVSRGRADDFLDTNPHAELPAVSLVPKGEVPMRIPRRGVKKGTLTAVETEREPTVFYDHQAPGYEGEAGRQRALNEAGAREAVQRDPAAETDAPASIDPPKPSQSQPRPDASGSAPFGNPNHPRSLPSPPSTAQA